MLDRLAAGDSLVVPARAARRRQPLPLASNDAQMKQAAIRSAVELATRRFEEMSWPERVPIPQRIVARPLATVTMQIADLPASDRMHTIWLDLERN